MPAVGLTFRKGFGRLTSARRRRVVALVSGGLDSCALVDALLGSGAVVVPVYIRCGLRWESVEVVWLTRWLSSIRHPRLAPLSILSLPMRALYQPHWSLGRGRVPSARSADAAVYLPGRNVLLLTTGAIIAAQSGASSLALGTLAGNPFGDATSAFFRQMAGCLSRALRRPLRIIAPLRRFTKAEVIRRHASLPFQLTFSCLNPRGLRHCGRCNKCAERMRAFIHAKIHDPTDYEYPGRSTK